MKHASGCMQNKVASSEDLKVLIPVQRIAASSIGVPTCGGLLLCFGAPVRSGASDFRVHGGCARSLGGPPLLDMGC